MTVSRRELAEVSTLAWLDDCICGSHQLEEYFVSAGHVIDEGVLNTARRCPVRRQEVIWAYTQGLSAGYFGGLSPGQRRTMSMDEALDFIENDFPLPVE